MNTSNTAPNQGSSPWDSEVRFLVIGRILGPVGVNGEIRARILTDFPDRFLQLESVHVGDSLRPYRIARARLESGTVLLKFVGIDDSESARALRNQEVQIPISEAATLPPDSFYWYQIVGLDVWTDHGYFLGKITNVLRTGSNDVFVVGSGANEILLPAIADVIRDVDIQKRKMVVHLLPGLTDQVP